jgi:methylthioribose-1-phosphate isomerase
MNVNGKHYETIWLKSGDPTTVQAIDQRTLPHRFLIEDITDYQQGIHAISDMVVRGAPLIGATAAWSIYLAAIEAQRTKNPDVFLANAARDIADARPTAVNLQWAVNRMIDVLMRIQDPVKRIETARIEAQAICKEDAQCCRNIGEHGLELISTLSHKKKGAPVNILTHCNAGWLATIDWGTATAPIYLAHNEGIAVHVWVDETRPRNQGSQLTAWELAQEGVPHTVIVDNVGGHLMQNGQVDLCITGTDRTSRNGDVANKIGTYLKALAAKDNDVPFYVAAPSTSIDWTMTDGLGQIPIEERSDEEVIFVNGIDGEHIRRVRIVPENSAVKNYAFDVTPARLVSGLITERGICAANESGLRALFPEKYQ